MVLLLKKKKIRLVLNIDDKYHFRLYMYFVLKIISFFDRFEKLQESRYIIRTYAIAAVRKTNYTPNGFMSIITVVRLYNNIIIIIM